MRKTFLIATMIATTAILLAGVGTAVAHKNGKGKGHKGPHGAFVLKGKLAPVTGATGASGATGATGATNVTGRAQAVQNKRKVVFDVHLKGLTPSAVYSAALYGDVDGQGCASTTNAAMNPPVFKDITADSDGNGKTKLKVSIKTLALDKTADYYVAARDASGATVSCGDLKAKKSKSKGHSNNGKGHK